jgi:hypothetical protein
LTKKASLKDEIIHHGVALEAVKTVVTLECFEYVFSKVIESLLPQVLSIFFFFFLLLIIIRKLSVSIFALGPVKRLVDYL